MAIFKTPKGELTYTECFEEGSPHVHGEIDRSYGTRYLFVPWTQAENFHVCALGWPELGTSADGGAGYATIRRQTPWAFPLLNTFNSTNSASRRNMYCSRSSFIGRFKPEGELPVVMFDGDPNGNGTPYAARYKTAKFTLHYDTPLYDIMSDAEFANVSADLDESTWKRYVTRMPRPQAETFSIDAGVGAFYYAGIANSGKGLPIAQTIKKILMSTNLAVTWHQIPENAVPFSLYSLTDPTSTSNPAIDKCIGCVNDRTFNGYPQGTLLMQAVEIRPIKSILNARLYDITYMFKYFRPQLAPYRYPEFPADLNVTVGNNHVYLPKHRIPAALQSVHEAGWYEALSDKAICIAAPKTNFGTKTAGKNIYDFANFANLFRPSNYVGG